MDAYTELAFLDVRSWLGPRNGMRSQSTSGKRAAPASNHFLGFSDSALASVGPWPVGIPAECNVDSCEPACAQLYQPLLTIRN